MKILHLLNSNSFSGAENIVCQIIDFFRDDKNFSMVYVSPEGPISETLKERNIVFCPVKKLSINELRRVIADENPDIIHAHDMRASVLAALVCGNIKLVSHIHNNAFDSRRISIKSLAYCLCIFKAKHIIWVSNSAYNGYIFKFLCKQKSSILRNIVDVNAIKNKLKADRSSYTSDIVYVGRLSYEKNPQRLLKIVKLISQSIPDVQVNIVGTGELEDELKELVKVYQLENNISFLGFQTNPYKIVYDSKCMLMTSRWEGMPLCVLEAMSLGVPIVSTPTDGLTELIEHDIDGYLSDDDDQLADYVISLIRNKMLRNKMSGCVYDKALKFNNLEIYKNVLKIAWL